MKKLTILYLIFMLLPLQMNAVETEIDGLWYRLAAAADTAEVISSKTEKYAGEIVIPATVNYNGVEYRVTSLGNKAFYGCKGITSITIPNSVTLIKGYVFYDCDGLTSITIPNSVTAIGPGAFSDCFNLASITIPNSVKKIHTEAFYGCSKMTSVTIGSGVNTIGWQAFHNCRSLKTITMRRPSPFDIDENAFNQEHYLSATLSVPTDRKGFFLEHDVWGKFASIVEEDMPDVEIDPSPFNNLHSRRLILSYTERDATGYMGGSGEDRIVQAMKFPEERMSHIKGNQITHIRFNLLNRFEHVSDMKVFIGSSRDERDLACQSVTDLHEGWNEVALDQPYTITGDSIVVGVDYLKGEKDVFYPVKWDSQAGQQEGACIYFREGNWGSSEGSWLIQGMVEGDHVPKYDLYIEQLVEPLYKRIVKAGEPYDFILMVRNWGSMPIQRYTMQVLLDGKEVECTPDNTPKIGRGSAQQTLKYHFIPTEGTPAGLYRLAVAPKTLNDEEYSLPATPREVPLKVYEHDMGRQKILVQVYTGTWCSNCPDFEKLVENKEKERDDLAVISIFTVNNMDWYYLIPACESYQSMMYADGVPNVDLNRYIEITTNNHRRDIITKYLDEAKNQPAFANVNIDGIYDDQNHVLNLTVSGERNEDFLPVEQWTNLTVLLVEDDIVGYQLGAADTQNYHHNAVIRNNISDTWGDRVEWDGDKYEMHYTTSLDGLKNNDGKYNVNNMRVVAFLGKPFTGNNYEEIGVVNCNEIKLTDLRTGIQEVSDVPAPTGIYDLNGRLLCPSADSLSTLRPGIYIVGGRKVVVK